MAKNEQNGETAEKKQKAEKKMALYHLYTEDGDGVLTPVGDAEGRNAEDAVAAYLETTGEDGEGQSFIIVPERNLSRVTVAVETKKRVRLTRA